MSGFGPDGRPHPSRFRGKKSGTFFPFFSPSFPDCGGERPLAGGAGAFPAWLKGPFLPSGFYWSGTGSLPGKIF